LLDRIGRTEGKAAWLPKGVIGVCQEPPLFKKKDVEPEEVTVDELVDRMSRALFQSEQTFIVFVGKSVFASPYTKRGVAKVGWSAGRGCEVIREL